MQRRSPKAERLEAEGLIDLETACAFIPARNAKGHASKNALMRWIVSGERGVKLESVRRQGKRMTTLAALERFRLAVLEAARQAVQPEQPEQEGGRVP